MQAIPGRDIIVDGIRIGTTWKEVSYLPPHPGISKESINNRLKIKKRFSKYLHNFTQRRTDKHIWNKRKTSFLGQREYRINRIPILNKGLVFRYSRKRKRKSAFLNTSRDSRLNFLREKEGY